MSTRSSYAFVNGPGVSVHMFWDAMECTNGLEVCTDGVDLVVALTDEQVIDFAAQLAPHVRRMKERPPVPPALVPVDAAAMAERERCAMLLDDAIGDGWHDGPNVDPYGASHMDKLREIRRRIRAGE